MVKWSFSRFNTFIQCPYKYYLRYIRKIYINKPNNNIVIGNGFGDFVEEWAHNPLLTRKEALNIYAKSCLKNKSLGDIHEIKEKAYIINQYFEKGMRIEPLIVNGNAAAEHVIRFTIMDQLFEGKIDIIDFEETIRDYKTSKKPYSKSDLDPVSGKGLQLMIYCLGFLREFKKIPPKRGFRVIVKENPIKVQDLNEENKKSELIEAKNYLEKTVLDILNAKSFKKKKNGLCDYCDYCDRHCEGRIRW